MTVLSHPQHPVILAALALARDWCTGQVIDGAPAIAHAVKVAMTLARYLPDAPPAIVAAALLHDAPYFAPDDLNLDATLTTQLGADVARVVRALEREHEQMAAELCPRVDTSDSWTVRVSAADKIVALGSILRRAQRADDTVAYWRTRAAFVARVPYFRAFHAAAAPLVTAAMAAELDRLVTAAERASHLIQLDEADHRAAAP